MTTRTLHERAREHMNAANKHTCASVFGDHYANIHPHETQNITFVTLKRVRRNDDLHLHKEEAIAINKYNPKLNRREENIGAGFLL